MTSSLPVLCKKVNVSYTRDYNEDFHEKNKSKSTSLNIFTAKETVLFRLTTGRLDSAAKKALRANFQQSRFWFKFFMNIFIIVPSV